ncbi:mitochondrial ribosome-associated GTPase 2 isoform X1 [Periplaneta americana]|uniref:mitochondrial ribosome-associated GTPase 2 isoform X1 n=1 Tax=Periplaneta americana TaxID=6978 RepID=UPI0037E76F51
MFSLLDPKCITWSVVRRALWQQRLNKSDTTAVALTSKKSKSARKVAQHFVDMRRVRAVGGKGGDGLISFLQLWCNETAGPDGGDGGNGGHVVFQASSNVRDLNHVTSVLKGEDGEKGYNKDCHGKSADHIIIQVPVGTIIRSSSGKVVGDLKVEGTMFVAARGGAGGRGNHFFVSPTEQAPKIAEYGADGEELQYVVEVRSMAHVGLIGFPNAGKSTLLQAISRARPKIAPYPFTTLKPHLGMIQYDDYEQVAVADLPGLMPGSHKNRGLGIAFLKHAERCASLLYLLDLSSSEPWTHLETLQYELSQFNSELLERPQVVVANKLDLPEAKKNLPLLKEHVNLPIVAISAKMGTNLEELLHIIKEMYEKYVKKSEDDESDML